MFHLFHLVLYRVTSGYSIRVSFVSPCSVSCFLWVLNTCFICFTLFCTVLPLGTQYVFHLFHLVLYRVTSGYSIRVSFVSPCTVPCYLWVLNTCFICFTLYCTVLPLGTQYVFHLFHLVLYRVTSGYSIRVSFVSSCTVPCYLWVLNTCFICFTLYCTVLPLGTQYVFHLFHLVLYRVTSGYSIRVSSVSPCTVPCYLWVLNTCFICFTLYCTVLPLGTQYVFHLFHLVLYRVTTGYSIRVSFVSPCTVPCYLWVLNTCFICFTLYCTALPLGTQYLFHLFHLVLYRVTSGYSIRVSSVSPCTVPCYLWVLNTCFICFTLYCTVLPLGTQYVFHLFHLVLYRVTSGYSIRVSFVSPCTVPCYLWVLNTCFICFTLFCTVLPLGTQYVFHLCSFCTKDEKCDLHIFSPTRVLMKANVDQCNVNRVTELSSMETHLGILIH